MVTEKTEKPEWPSYDKDEIEKLILKLKKEGCSQSKAGLILRDQYGIPNIRKYGIRLSEVMGDKIPEDLYSLLKRAVSVRSHLEKNRKDSTSKHGFEKIESQIRRLAKYYIKTGKLPKGWKYTIESAKLIIK
ncbi:MAG: 30S ribosomal protein S15 [Candidatus Aenigmatarchaeota archaeon]